MANTFIKIASVSLTSATASIDFTSIPATYTDLCIKASIKEATSNNFTAEFKINNSATAAEYSFVQLSGNGSGVTTDKNSAQIIPFIVDPGTYSGTTNVFGNAELYFPNYAGATNKSISIDSVSEIDAASLGFQRFSAGLWSITTAINRITIYLYAGGNLAQYSTATLYGIKNS